jgi:hypothetical protein
MAAGDDATLAATARFVEHRFWPDGMVRVTGREMHGLLETPCFQHGEMSCLSCHAMHARSEQQAALADWTDDQLSPGMRGDRACTQCHESLAANVEAHTHHGAASEGSRCYNCHMPHTSYGLLKAVRSHQVDSPRVQTELATGRPNACNLCHLDRTLAWTADALQRWYAIERPALDEDHAQIAAGVLWMLTGDAGVRALAAWSLGWKPALDAAHAAGASSWAAGYLGHLLADPYDAVRFVAARSLAAIAPEMVDDVDFLAPVAARADARERMLEAWRGTAGKRDADSAVMLDERTFERLARNRNDVRVELHE